MSNFHKIQTWAHQGHLMMYFENFLNGDDVWAELHENDELWIYAFEEDVSLPVEKVTLREFLERVLSK